MKVLKFGGTSVKDAGRFREVAAILLRESRAGRIAVVLSTMKGCTDDLILAARQARAGTTSFQGLVAGVLERHRQAARELLPDAAACTAALGPLETMGGELMEVLHGISLVRECSDRSMDLVMSFGERLTCRLAAAYFTSVGIPSWYADSREFIVTDNSYGSALVDFRASYAAMADKVLPRPGMPVVTGFIAATSEGVTTTLGRNGSDYTGSIVGAGLKAESVEIWTDVDGVLSADPRFVKDAFVIDEMSYEEAMEMSFFGAKVIHPYTMIPAVESNTPLWIKNTMNPAARGTLIARDIRRHSRAITGIASIENVALVNVQGGGMVGIPGMAGRIFTALARARVNIVMISQASSEHSICFVIRQEQAEAASEALRAEMGREMKARLIEDIKVLGNLEIVAVIGENMRGIPGISGRLFSALGQAGINVLAIAQGSSELNVSFVIEGRERETALNTVHRAFFG
jgi:bifunctional aspartokinase / homoserine dehydrogenase 1